MQCIKGPVISRTVDLLPSPSGAAAGGSDYISQDLVFFSLAFASINPFCEIKHGPMEIFLTAAKFNRRLGEAQKARFSLGPIM